MVGSSVMAELKVKHQLSSTPLQFLLSKFKRRTNPYFDKEVRVVL